VERTLILIKPDALARGLAGTVLSRFEAKGLKIAGLKMLALTDGSLADHYSHLVDKPFYPGIAEFMKSSPVIAVCLEGREAVDVCRSLCGVTNARKAAPGTIRGDLSVSMQCNLVHASDSPESAAQEVARFFKKDELFAYQPALIKFLLAGDEM
jgi:nucleoside-diphosphate kinase